MPQGLTTSLFNLYLDKNFEGLMDFVCFFSSEAILYLTCRHLNYDFKKIPVILEKPENTVPKCIESILALKLFLLQKGFLKG